MDLPRPKKFATQLGVRRATRSIRTLENDGRPGAGRVDRLLRKLDSQSRFFRGVKYEILEEVTESTRSFRTASPCVIHQLPVMRVGVAARAPVKILPGWPTPTRVHTALVTGGDMQETAEAARIQATQQREPDGDLGEDGSHL